MKMDSGRSDMPLDESNHPNFPINNPKNKKRNINPNPSSSTLAYKGINFNLAASQGNLPICVLLWGMASAKKINLMASDETGCNPSHFAVMADTVETFNFINQQVKGIIPNTDIKVVESRNLLGETPLIRSLVVGKLPVIKALLEYSSDPFAHDSSGNNVFILAIKHGHLWCLNYLFMYIRNSFGDEAALNLLSQRDNLGYKALDWAAIKGNVNIIEYLIRLGMSPYETDSNLRSPLYWAVLHSNIDAVGYLVRLGCDPHQKDLLGRSPFELATTYQNISLLSAVSQLPFILSQEPESLQVEPSSSFFLCFRRKHHLQRETSVKDDGADRLHPPLAFRHRDNIISNALYRDRSLNKGFILAYTVLILIIWIVAIYTPFWSWIILLVLVGFLFRNLATWFQEHENDLIDDDRVNGPSKSQTTDGVPENQSSLPTEGLKHNQISFWGSFLSAREKYIGMYFGCYLAYFVYLFLSFMCSAVPNSRISYMLASNTKHKVQYFLLYSYDGDNFSGLNGLNSYKDHPAFFVTTAILFLLCGFLYFFMLNSDPGILDTRQQDHDEIFNLSYLTQSPPSPVHYCHTALMKKPFRSKYCQQTGAVIARMDHYCMFMNNSIGVNNHRLFMVFLYCHCVTMSMLISMILQTFYDAFSAEYAGSRHSDESCLITKEILKSNYFFTVMLLFFSVIVFLGILLLSYQQTSNIFANITMNERYNYKRYGHYIFESDGNYRNVFDRGYLINFCEFWGLHGYQRDYKNLYELSPELLHNNSQKHKSTHWLCCESSSGCGELNVIPIKFGYEPTMVDDEVSQHQQIGRPRTSFNSGSVA